MYSINIRFICSISSVSIIYSIYNVVITKFNFFIVKLFKKDKIIVCEKKREKKRQVIMIL